MKMPPFPEMPELCATTERDEVWGLMLSYALAYGELVREECEKAVSEVAREWFEHDGRMSEGGKAVCAAIRRKD